MPCCPSLSQSRPVSCCSAPWPLLPPAAQPDVVRAAQKVNPHSKVFSAAKMLLQQSAQTHQRTSVCCLSLTEPCSHYNTASRCMHHCAAWGQSMPFSLCIRPTIMLQQRLLAMQDELYRQHLTDACHDAVRQLLGPRKALLWSRQVKGCLPQVVACFMLLFPPVSTWHGRGVTSSADSNAGLLVQLTQCQSADTIWVEGVCLSR